MQRYVLFALVLLVLGGCVLPTRPGAKPVAVKQGEEPSKRQETLPEETARLPAVSLPLGAARHRYLGPCL